MIGSNPVLGEGFLRGRNIKLAAANHVAHPFQPILGLGIPFRLDDLRPRLRSFEIMHYELTDHEWAAIKPMLPDRQGDIPRSRL